jgi:hypothetical protein
VVFTEVVWIVVASHCAFIGIAVTHAVVVVVTHDPEVTVSTTVPKLGLEVIVPQLVPQSATPSRDALYVQLMSEFCQ